MSGWWPIELPWQAARRRFETLLDQFAVTNGAISGIAEYLARPAPKPLDPFVCVHVEATHKESGRRVTLGRSGRVTGRQSFKLTAWHPLTNVSVVVFCDLERVAVRQITRGVEVVNGAIGECATAYFDEWMTGVDLNVHCELL